MNSKVFSADALDLPALESYCTSIPFLTHRRLAILERVEKLPKDSAFREAFFELLERLPAHSALVLVEKADMQHWRSEDRYHKASTVFEWVAAHPVQTFIQRCATPHGAAFVAWILSHCQEMGASIDQDAAQLLAELVAEDPFLAHQELSKLSIYVDGQRPISVADVELLTPFHAQSDIFAMVDAAGDRNGKVALKHLHRLLEEEDPRYIFVMLVRQFRLIIQAREAIELGQNPKAALPSKTPDFVIKKISAQAQNFQLRDLERMYRELLEIDLASKTGGPELEVALDHFIADLTRKRGFPGNR
jgi:DNA polymerase-3 subunit delta